MKTTKGVSGPWFNKKLAAILLLPFIALLIAYLAFTSPEEDAVYVEQHRQNPVIEEKRKDTVTVAVPPLSKPGNIKPKVQASIISEEDEEDTRDYDEAQPNPRLLGFTNSITAGDSRTPPILRQEPEEQPKQEDLDDPDKYLAFQARQKQKVLISYVNAAKPKLNKLRALVAEGEKRGISKEQLAEGKAKIQKIEDMVEQIKAENPELISAMDSEP